jgi:hypothetical protein
MLRSNILGAPEPHFWELAIIDMERGRTTDTLIKQQHLPEMKAKLDKIRATVKDMKDFMKEFETRGLDIYQDFTNE